MTFAIPAAPGTFLNHRTDADQPPTVIVGWLVHPGGLATPVTFDPVGDLEDYFVVVGAVGPATAHTGPAKPAPAPPAAQTSTRAPAAAPAAPAGDVDIFLTGKEYTKRTFWHFTVGEHQAVLLCEGGNPVPVGENVAKISRDDFYVMKKQIRDLTYEQVPGWLTKVSAPAADEDDDDLF